MKAVLTDRLVAGPEWLFERKLDGIRCGVFRSEGDLEASLRQSAFVFAGRITTAEGIHFG